MITPENFLEQMRKIDKNKDQEEKHVDADGLMCKVLREHGYGEGVDIFEEMEIWYA